MVDEMNEQEQDEMIVRAIAAGARADATEPRAQSAWYDAESDRVVIALRNGVELRIPRSLLQGLQQTSPEELTNVEILADGYGLHWEEPDVDFTIPGLAAGIFGTKSWMSRLGGRSRSQAKGEAARRNGAKGGRPRKSVVQSA